MGMSTNTANPTLPKAADQSAAPSGYQRPEIGEIPVDWDVKTLANMGQFLGGAGFPIRYQGLRSGDYPFFKVSDMNTPGNELFLRQANHYISEDIRTKLNAALIPRDSIVFAKIGAAVFLERKRLLSQDSCIDNNMMAFRPTDEDASLRFLHFVMLRLHFGDLVATTALPSLSSREIGAVKVAMPPLHEQDAIAEALSDVDGLIGALEKLIAKKRAIKQAAMQQLLTGKTRLPGFSGEWEEKRLGEVASFLKGKGLSKSALNPYGVAQCVHYGELFTQYGETISETISRTNEADGMVRSVANDVLMPTSDVTPRGLAKASCVVHDNIVLGGDILVIRTAPDVANGTFLSHVIRREKDQVLKLVTGTTVFHLYGTDMKNFIFKLPPLVEQQAIVDVLTDMDAEITALEHRRDKTQQIKQGMMQQLLTGRVRLVGGEATA